MIKCRIVRILLGLMSQSIEPFCFAQRVNDGGGVMVRRILECLLSTICCVRQTQVKILKILGFSVMISENLSRSLCLLSSTCLGLHTNTPVPECFVLNGT